MPMKYDDLITNVSDIKDKRGQKIIVDLDIYDGNNYITSYEILLDLKQMGISKNMDYEYQLSKDLSRVVRQYYYANNELPKVEDIQEKMHQKNYLSISLPKEIFKIAKKKIVDFNKLCVDWDYRNIDMNDSHISGIDIKDNIVFINCEKYDEKLDSYLYCVGAIVGSEKLLDKFNNLDLTKYEDVLNFITELNDYVEWNQVDISLSQERDKELKKLDTVDLEEIEK